MYHFVAGETAPETLVLSGQAKVSGQICQYLRGFQIAAIKFLYSHLNKHEFCILNDENGLGKSVSVVVLLGAVACNKKCLIVTQNDDNIIAGWQFHFDVLTDLAVSTLISDDSKGFTDNFCNIYLATWSALRSIGDLSKMRFDYVIVDNRGQMLRNNFCTSMLLKNYERKVNVLLSSVDVTSDTKLLYNVLRLGGLESQYESYKLFEEKFKLPDTKEIIKKKIDLEEYFLKREALRDYCKHFRLRRYRHQFENLLPLVEPEQYKLNLELWRSSKQNSNSTSSGSVEYVPANLRIEARNVTDNPFEEDFRSMKQETLLNEEVTQIINRLETQHNTFDIVDVSEEPVDMSPLVFVTDSESDDDIERISILSDKPDDCVLVSSESQELEESVLSDASTNTKKKKIKKPKNKKDIATRAEKRKLRSQQNELKQRTRQAKTNAKQQTNNGNNHLKSTLKKLVTQKAIERMRKSESKTKINVKTTKKTITTDEVKSKEETINHNKTERKEPIKVESKKVEIQTPKRSVRAEKHAESPCEQPKTIRNNGTITTPQKQHSKDTAQLQSPNKTLKKESAKPSTSITTTPLRGRAVKEVDRKNVTTKEEISKDHNVQSVNKSTTKSPKTPTAIVQKVERCASTPSVQQRRSKLSAVSTPLHSKQTRFMDRITRSSGSLKNKYMRTSLALDIDMKPYSSKRQVNKKTTPKVKISTPCKEIKSTTTETAAPKQSQIVKPQTNTVNNVNVAKVTKDNDKKVSIKATKESHKENKIILKEVKADTGNKTATRRQESQISVMSTSSSEYEEIQCGQKFSLELLGSEQSFRHNKHKRSNGFLVPSTPPSMQISPPTPAMLPSLSLFTAESDVLFVTPAPAPAASGVGGGTKTKSSNADIILVNSSQDECSMSSLNSETSRRTRALKHKRPQSTTKNATGSGNKTKQTTDKALSAFGDLLAKQKMIERSFNNKSPDLFSNCSDMLTAGGGVAGDSTLHGAQEKSTFEGFKIFGSEVKQFQQQHAATNKRNSLRRERSCLDILEKMFEPRGDKLPAGSAQQTQQKQKQQKSPTTQQKQTPTRKALHKSKSTQILPTLPTRETQESPGGGNERHFRPNTIDDDEDIFEITNNATFGSTMRINANGDISPVATQNQLKATQNGQNNKITNYLTSTATAASNSKEHAGNTTPKKQSQQQQQQLSGAATARRSPKSPKSNKSLLQQTQTTKLTKWFPRNGNLINGNCNGNINDDASAAVADKDKTKSNAARSAKANVKREDTQRKSTLRDAKTVELQKSTRSTVKRRRLDLSFKN